jgi:hypothetical protein
MLKNKADAQRKQCESLSPEKKARHLDTNAVTHKKHRMKKSSNFNE